MRIIQPALVISASAPVPQDGEVTHKDWVFINYTFKRFEGLTQRGAPNKKQSLPLRAFLVLLSCSFLWSLFISLSSFTYHPSFLSSQFSHFILNYLYLISFLNCLTKLHFFLNVLLLLFFFFFVFLSIICCTIYMYNMFVI